MFTISLDMKFAEWQSELRRYCRGICLSGSVHDLDIAYVIVISGEKFWVNIAQKNMKECKHSLAARNIGAGPFSSIEIKTQTFTRICIHLFLSDVWQTTLLASDMVFLHSYCHLAICICARIDTVSCRCVTGIALWPCCIGVKPRGFTRVGEPRQTGGDCDCTSVSVCVGICMYIPVLMYVSASDVGI